MLKVKYCRNSLCAGDDSDRSVYTLILPNTATMGDLIYAMQHKGNGNDWHMPIGEWIVRSNLGLIAKTHKDHSVEYLIYKETTPIAGLGIEWVYGDWENGDQYSDSIWL